MSYPEVRIGLCKCYEEKLFGIRLEKTGKNWCATWAFPIKKKGAEKRENFEKTVIKGGIMLESEYPGCPYCGSKAFVICDSCGCLNCNNSSSSIFTCKWCGNSGELGGYSGDGFYAGYDR